MNQATIRSGSTTTVRSLAEAILKRLRAVLLSIKPTVAEILVFGAMFVAAFAINLVQIAVSNPAVAEALTSGRLFF